MNIKRKLIKTIGKIIASPIKIKFEKGGVRHIQDVAPYPKEVFWDESVPVHSTASGIDFVRTPEERFEKLSDYSFAPNYIEIDGLRMHYLDEGPKDGQIILLLHGQPVWCYLYRKMIPILANDGYRCIAPDMMGMGKSDKPIKESFHFYDRHCEICLLYTSPSPRDQRGSRMPSSA